MRQWWKTTGFALLTIALFGVVTTTHAIADANADNQLRRGNFLEPESLDPHVSRGVEASTILRDLYEGLTREGPDGKILPGVAKSWQVDAEGRRWVFKLHDTARWSNGDPVTAEDFVYGFRRALSPATATPFADSLAPIENATAVLAGDSKSETLGVHALDEHTLEIRLERPVPYLLGLLAHHSTYPVHATSIEQHGNTFTRPGNHVSNGAYHLREWKVNERIVLVRNPHYREHDQVRIESVAYLPIDDEEAEFNRFRSGEIDITQTIPIRRYAWLVENMPEQLHVTPYLSTYFYGFNLRREPFRDAPGLRRALSMVIDRKILAEKVLGVGELPAYALNPPGIDNHSAPQPDYAAWSMEKRITAARQLLHEAGYSADNQLEIELRFNTGDNHRRVALAVSSMWQQHLGVRTRLVNEEWKVFLQNRRTAALTQVFRSAWVGDYNDPTTFLNLLQSDHPLNDYGYRNREYDALLEAAEQEMDARKRRELLQQAEGIMLTDHPLMPLYYYVSKHLVAERVGGWEDNIMDHHATRDLYLRD
jgi:oligopeptide transport system substrate-binding protein